MTKRRPGQAPRIKGHTTHPYTVRLTRPEWDRLARAARKNGITVSDQIRRFGVGERMCALAGNRARSDFAYCATLVGG